MLPPPSSAQALARDYYDILGVGRQATKAELKRAYRRLALRYHPDRNPGSAEAAARFREVMEAYAVLSNPIRRWHYDHRGEFFGSETGRAGRPWWRRPSAVGLGLSLAALIVLGSYLALQAGGSDRDGAYELVVAGADSLFEGGDYRGALELYFEARRLRPTPYVLVRLDESMNRITRGVEGRPASAEALAWGDSLVRQADRLRAGSGASEAGRTRAAERYAEASEVYLVALREAPGDSALIGRTERVTERMREVLASGDAEAEPVGSVEQTSTDAATAEMQRQLLFIVHSQQGDALMGEGKLREARAKYEEALAYRPGDPYLLSRMGQADELLSAAGREVASAGTTLARRPPASIGVEAVRGRTSKSGEGAEWQYRHFRARGEAAMARADYQAATAHYESALASKPEDAPVAERLTEARAALRERAGGAPIRLDGAYLVMTKPPEPVGGLPRLYRHVEYPAEAQRNGVGGWVFARFIVSAGGDVRGLRILRGLGHGCDEEVLRAIRRARFVPGEYDGKAVDAWLTLPFFFDGGGA